VADPFTFRPPSSFGPPQIRLAVIDVALEYAGNLLQAIRAANVPTILVSAPGAPPPAGDPLTQFGGWTADAYASSPEELVRAAAIALELHAMRDGPALHLTYRGSLPPEPSTFLIGTAFPLRDGAALFLGRSRSLAVQLASPHVGRAHALVAALPGPDRRVIAVDLKSGNGTLIKGSRVPVDILLPGDEIAIAGYRFVIEALAEYSA
jgi:hypothetical protein